MHCSLQATVISVVRKQTQFTLRDVFPLVNESLYPAMVLSCVSDGSLDLSGQLNTAFRFGESMTPAARFCALSSYIAQLPSLHDVAISNNGLGDASCGVVAESLRPHAGTLSSLSMGNNGNLLYTPDNELYGLLKSCTALTSLDVSRSNVSKDSLQPLCDVVAHMTSLRRLNIGFVSLLNGLLHVLQPPSGLPYLTYLNISSVTRDFREVAATISKLSALRELDASDNCPTWEGASWFLRAVQQMPSLEHLKIDNWRMKRPRGRHHESIETRSLERCIDNLAIPLGADAGMLQPGRHQMFWNRHEQQGHVAANPQAEGAQGNTHARSKRLSEGNGSRLKTLSAQRFCEKLSDLSGRQRPWNPVTLQWLEVLDLTAVDLQSERPPARAQVATVNILCSFRRLRELHVAFCSLSAASLTLLCGRLEQAHASGETPGLTHLNWSGNEVTAESLEAVCGLTTLQMLTLRGCRTSVNNLYNDQQTIQECYISLGEHVSRLQALSSLILGSTRDKLEAVLPAIMAGCRELPRLDICEIAGVKGTPK
jgi:hypothetical protein